ncbi:MAG: hypothetical protein JWQ81_7712 [Amycolatopsis sp.]|uniref:hypothetical protein n=1 Tax=Amycolatopsis sp. TaxID=37632 RepID=UPI00261421B9|nr:hypothetical protein [Amycolatopsis sp.]MCU1686973.1 hypothetical protein [Amycolatopsis sp.]
MPVTETVELGPTTQVMHAVEVMWAEIRRRHPDVPEAILVLASGTSGATNEIYGHFARSRWHVGEGHEPRAEFFLGAEGLRRSPAEILGTTLHEAAHGLAVTRDIDDVSDGRYHNKRFQQLAYEMGLTTTQAPRIGWSATTPMDSTVTAYRRELVQLEKALTVWRHTEAEVIERAHYPPVSPTADPDDAEQSPTEPPRPPKLGAVDGRGAHRGGDNYIVVVCGCPKPRLGRFALSVFELAGVRCDACEQPFRVRD